MAIGPVDRAPALWRGLGRARRAGRLAPVLGWIVAAVVVVPAALALAAWLPARRLRRELEARTAEHDAARTRLRLELSAAVAVTARAEAEAERARHAAQRAQREQERLQQRLVEDRAHRVDAEEHRAALAESEALREEVALLRRELELIGPVIAELRHHRSYVESLQRELGLRDEQVLTLEHQQRPALPVRPSVIDLTDAHLSAGQGGHAGVVEPGVEEVVEGPLGDR